VETATEENCQVEQQPTCNYIWICKIRDVAIFEVTYICMYLQKFGDGSSYLPPSKNNYSKSFLGLYVVSLKKK